MYQSGQSQSVDGGMPAMQGGLPSKTPVSLLQELCMRRGMSPIYDLLQIEGPVHEPTFVYRVTVGEYAANGSGQTKKKAKHAAAKSVLDTIIQGGSGSQTQSGNSTELSSQIVSPYHDGIPGNPVGALQELCMSRRWPPPNYKLTGEEGFPHERTFSICCTIGNHKEIGAGKSKKLSKRQAAHKMLQKLKDQPVEHPPMNVLADDDDEVNESTSAYRAAFFQACQEGASLPSIPFGASVANSCGANLSVMGARTPSSTALLENASSTPNASFTKPPSTLCSCNNVCPYHASVSGRQYKVCEACFNLINENERGRVNGQSSQLINFSTDLVLNGRRLCGGKDLVDNNANLLGRPSLNDLPENKEVDEVFRVDFDTTKLELLFDKLFTKQNDELKNAKGRRNSKGDSGDESTSSTEEIRGRSRAVRIYHVGESIKDLKFDVEGINGGRVNQSSPTIEEVDNDDTQLEQSSPRVEVVQ